MTRPISVTTSTATRQTVTQPIYLIELGFSSVIRLSTRGTVTWNSLTWTGESCAQNPVEIETDGNGAQTGIIRLVNLDNAMSALVLGEGVNDKTCKIWKVYGDGPYAIDDAEQVFDGVMDAPTSITLQSVEISISSQGMRLEYAPRSFAGPPVMNHTPPDGFVLRWAGDSLELRRRNG